MPPKRNSSAKKGKARSKYLNNKSKREVVEFSDLNNNELETISEENSEYGYDNDENETSLVDDNEEMSEEKDSEIVNQLSREDEIIIKAFIDMIDAFISNESSTESFRKMLENKPLPLDAHDIGQIRKYSSRRDNNTITSAYSLRSTMWYLYEPKIWKIYALKDFCVILQILQEVDLTDQEFYERYQRSYFNALAIFKMCDMYEEEQFYSEKALKKVDVLKDDLNHYKILHNLGQAYLFTGNYKKALPNFIEAVNIRKKIIREKLSNEEIHKTNPQYFIGESLMELRR